ncbi:MAG: uracil-xanthine permease [Clostridia bacterium]|nr:uracil-xanthine permease [Clostridia bacterium]
MKMIYNVEDKPKFGQVIVFALQQLLAIMAATLVVPVIINGNAGLEGKDAMSTAAALFGAGVGTLVYLLFTKFKSPVFLGSSFAFIGSMTAAFAGAVGSVALGYLGLIMGAIFAGLVYVIIAIIVKFVGVGWINKLMPAAVIGPTVAIIGLSLAGNAVGDLQKSSVTGEKTLIAVVCGIITLIVTALCATYGKKMARLTPFIFGILAGYAVSVIFTIIGNVADIDALRIISFDSFKALTANGVGVDTFINVKPSFTFLTAIKGFGDINASYISTIALAYIPVAFVVFAEHIADHKNISSIIERDLLENPGLSRTLLGDGVGSMAGAVFGGCPNTTYGESVACVAITRNASIVTIFAAAIGAIIISFISPFIAFVNSIPSCVMGGVCMALYGFIAVSGLKMIQKVDLGKNRNLFVVSSILIAGIGGLTLSFGKITITSIATALILGIIVNVILSKKGTDEKEEEAEGNDAQ